MSDSFPSVATSERYAFYDYLTDTFFGGDNIDAWLSIRPEALRGALEAQTTSVLGASLFTSVLWAGIVTTSDSAITHVCRFSFVGVPAAVSLTREGLGLCRAWGEITNVEGDPYDLYTSEAFVDFIETQRVFPIENSVEVNTAIEPFMLRNALSLFVTAGVGFYTYGTQLWERLLENAKLTLDGTCALVRWAGRFHR